MSDMILKGNDGGNKGCDHVCDIVLSMKKLNSPVELSAMMEKFCICAVEYDSDLTHVARKDL